MADDHDDDLTIDGRALLAELLGHPEATGSDAMLIAPEADAPESTLRSAITDDLPVRGPTGLQVAVIVMVAALSLLLFGTWFIAGLS